VAADIQTQQRRIEMIGLDQDDVPAPLSWNRKNVVRVPTGVDWLDNHLGGGMEQYEINAVLGPTGVAKTLLAVQIAMCSAKQQHLLLAEGADITPGLYVLISYELPMVMLQIRMMAQGAQIPKSRLEQIQTFDDLSTRHNLRPYEMAWQGDLDISRREGEVERLEEMREWANKYVVPVDFSSAPSSSGGRGYIDEVVYKLSMLQDKHQMPIKQTELDWAGVSVDRFLESQNNIDQSSKTQQLGTYIRRVHDQVTTQFNCTAWVMHQLRGQVNKVKPGTPLHHSDAQWCASFADSAWAAFVLGTKDRQKSCCTLAVTKTRNSASSQQWQIMNIDGEYSQLVPSQDYMIDPHTKAIVRRQDAAQLADYSDEDAELDAERRRALTTFT
jgi:hypothetical protein